MSDPFKHHLRLKRPCGNCPFLKHGAIQLRPGRLEGIVSDLETGDSGTFQRHKTVHSARGGDWDGDDNYAPSGHEAMCAGAAAYLLKRGRPTELMRLAFAFGAATPSDWDDAKSLVIDGQ